MMNAKRAIRNLSDGTRAFFDAVEEINADPRLTSAQRAQLTDELARSLTPEQRDQVQREALNAAIELQLCNPAAGTRAERRAARRERSK